MIPLTLLTEMHPAVKAVIAVTIATLGLLWGYAWIGEPLVVVAPSEMGAYAIGPIIVVDPGLYYSEDQEYLLWVLAHEKAHTMQFALYGPLAMPVLYTAGAINSLLTEGDIWYGNWMELEANAWADAHPYTPTLTLKIAAPVPQENAVLESYPWHFGYHQR